MDEFLKGCLTDEDILYHYCSMESFTKIIESKKIRLGNVLQMNDPTELALRSFNWIELLYKLYEREPFEFKLNLDNKELDIKKYLDLLSYHQDSIKSDSFFAFCMSTCYDDLNQWRVYGGNGNGVCLGFDVNGIINLTEKDKSFDYEELEYRDLHKISELAAQSILAKIRDSYTANDIEQLTKLVKDFYSELKFFVLRYKHPAYKAESEARLLYRKHLIHGDDNQMKADDIIIESSGSNIKTYKEIALSDITIKNITFGPINKVPLDNILLFLYANGINIKPNQIFYSEIPYRAT